MASKRGSSKALGPYTAAERLVKAGLFDERPIMLDGWQLRAYEAVPVGQPSAKQTQAALAFASAVQEASGYWVGDILRYTDDRREWTDKADQIKSVTGLAHQTLKNLSHVCQRVAVEERELAPSVGHAAEVASMMPAKQRTWLKKAKTEGWNVLEFRLELRADKRRGVISGQAELAGMFRVIYADPPWLYNDRGVINTGDNYGRAERHYKGQTIEQLCKLPVAAHARPDAVLFLWVTTPFLLLSPGPREVIREWGFEYKTSAVWDKVEHNFGHYFSVRHEHLLVCTRGSCTPDRPTPMIDSVQTIRRGDVHSEKPEEFRKIIERLYDGPYLELFARRQVPGWTCWGDQVLEDAQATA